MSTENSATALDTLSGLFTNPCATTQITKEKRKQKKNENSEANYWGTMDSLCLCVIHQAWAPFLEGMFQFKSDLIEEIT